MLMILNKKVKLYKEYKGGYAILEDKVYILSKEMIIMLENIERLNIKGLTSESQQLLLSLQEKGIVKI